MLCLCSLNLHTFQHGHPGYLGALQKTSDSNDISCSYMSYFLDFANDKMHTKKNIRFLTDVNQYCLINTSTAFSLPDVVQRH